MEIHPYKLLPGHLSGAYHWEMVKILIVFVVHRVSGGPEILLWVLTALYSPSSLSVDRTCEWLLTNRVWQWWWAVTSMNTLRYIRLCPAGRLALEACCLFLAGLKKQAAVNPISRRNGSCWQPWQWGSRFFPIESPDENPALGKPWLQPCVALSRGLSSAVPALLTHRNYEKMYVLFKAGMSVVIGYAAIDDWYSF